MIEIGAARGDERKVVEELLGRVDLPLEGVAGHFGGFLVARDGGR